MSDNDTANPASNDNGTPQAEVRFQLGRPLEPVTKEHLERAGCRFEGDIVSVDGSLEHAAKILGWLHEFSSGTTDEKQLAWRLITAAFWARHPDLAAGDAEPSGDTVPIGTAAPATAPAEPAVDALPPAGPTQLQEPPATAPSEARPAVTEVTGAAEHMPQDETGTAAPPPDLSVTILPDNGTYDAPLEIRFSCPTKGATIYYTASKQDDAAPSTDVKQYGGHPMGLNRSATLRAWASIDAHEGPVTERAYTLQVPGIKASPEPGTYNPPLTLDLACTDGEATIRYTLDGTVPLESSTAYDPEERIFLSESQTVKARAFHHGWQPSDVMSAAYELKAPQWNELEPQDLSDPVPHTVQDFIELGEGWRIAAASVRGKLHAHRGLWRDDSFSYAVEGPWTIMAVADGAGSASLSRIGAGKACTAAVKYLEQVLHTLRLTEAGEDVPKEQERLTINTHLQQAAREAQAAIRNEAAARSRPPGDFACTLLVAICCPWREAHLVAAIQVGDGYTAVLSADGTVKPMCVPDHGEHSSETRFLTTKEIEISFPARVLFALPKQLSCIALMTDGVSDDFFPEDTRLVELFSAPQLETMKTPSGQSTQGLLHGVLQSPNPGEALLEWLRYDKKGSSDDRTLLLLFRRNRS